MADVRLLHVLVVLILVATSHAATRIAILAAGNDAQVGDVAAITEATLAQSDDLTVLERQQVDRILAEQKLSLSGLVEADQAMNVGKLLSCQMLVILEPEPGASQFGLVIFDPATGVRLTDFSISGETADCAKAVINAIRTADQKRRSPTQVHTVCLLSVRNADLPRDIDGFCDAVGRLLERNLIGSSSIALLERSRLEQVTSERTLAADAATHKLLASVILIDLQVERHGQGVEGTVLLSDATRKVFGKVTGVATSIDALQLARTLADALSGNLKVPPPPRLDPLAEAARFYSEWDFRSQNRDYLRAIAPAEAAHALAPSNLLYHASLAEALIEHGQALYRGQDFKPHASTEPWERHDLVPASLTRGAQMLADIQPGASVLKGTARDVIQRHLHTAAAGLRNFIASATWFQTNQTDRAPLPSSDVAAVKRSLRQYLLREDADLLSAVTDDTTYRAYSGHLPELLSDNEWLYSINADQWTNDFEGSARNWLALHSKCPEMFSQDVIDALDAIAVEWQLEKHAGTKLYAGTANARTRRWDPSINGIDRLSSIQRILASDRSELVRWYGALLELSIDITPYFHSPDRIRQSVSRFIDKMTPLFTGADLIQRPDLRQALYHILIQADTLLDATQYKGEYSLRLLDLSLSRHEVVANVVGRSLRQFRVKMIETPSDREREVAIYERVLKVLDSPECTVFGFDTPAIARTAYFRNLERLRNPADQTTTRPATRPWYRSRQLMDVLHATEGVRAIFDPIVDGDYVDVLGAQPMSEQIQATRLQLLRIPLNGGPPLRLGMLPTQGSLDIQPDGFSLNITVTAACLADGRYCASTWRDGILIFPTDGRFPQRLDERAGLPDTHAGAIALMDGQIFAALGVDRGENYLIRYDLANKQLDVIASSTRKEKRSPFDDQPGIHVVGLTSDAPRHRIIAAVVCREDRPRFSGLWEYRPATKHWRYLLPVHPVINLKGDGINIANIVSVHRPTNDVLTFTVAGTLLAFDLQSDRAFALAKLDGPDPVLPAETPLWKSLTPAGVETLQQNPFGFSRNPRALIDPWLWCDWGRINLSTGQTQKYELFRRNSLPRPMTDLQSIGDGSQLLMGDQMGLWVVSVAP